MLYLTTREPRDAYTSHRALTEQRTKDGGLYVPFRIPRLSPEMLASLAGKPFNHTLAQILNLFFNTRLTGWDVDLVCGKFPVRLKCISHKILFCEFWHNHEGTYSAFVQRVSRLMLARYPEAAIGEWPNLALRIGALFGIYGELIRGGILQQGQTMDVSLVTGDFSAAMAVWYARTMGLPVANIICVCEENDSLWEFMRHGHLSPDEQTPASLERLIHACGGFSETAKIMNAQSKGKLYRPNEILMNRMRQGFSMRVCGRNRISSAVSGLYSSAGYLVSPDAALAFCGVQDHRASRINTEVSLVLYDDSPNLYLPCLSGMTGVSEDALSAFIDKM